MARLGRNLELFVANLEKFLRGSGLKVTCPEYLVARKDEGAQELDITVRGRVGDRDVLVILACRDRRAPEGRDWIRQVSTARKEFGATEVVAVSSKGFTKPARALAKRLRVDLRTVRQLSAEDAARLPWIAASATFTVFATSVRIRELLHVVFDTAGFADSRAAMAAGLDVLRARRRILDPVLVRTADGSAASLQDVANLALAHHGPEFRVDDRGPPLSLEELRALEGQLRTFRLTMPNAADRFAVPTALGAIPLHTIEFRASLHVEERTSTRAASTSFSSEKSGALAESVAFEANLPTGLSVLEIHRKAGPMDAPQQVGIVLRPKPAPPRPRRRRKPRSKPSSSMRRPKPPRAG